MHCLLQVVLEFDWELDELEVMNSLYGVIKPTWCCSLEIIILLQLIIIAIFLNHGIILHEVYAILPVIFTINC